MGKRVGKRAGKGIWSSKGDWSRKGGGTAYVCKCAGGFGGCFFLVWAQDSGRGKVYLRESWLKNRLSSKV